MCIRDRFKEQPELVQIGRVVREALLEKLIQLIDNPDASLDVRSIATSYLKGIVKHKPVAGNPPAEFAFHDMLSRRVRQVLERPFLTSPESKTLRQPPGSPIGSGR